MVVLEEAGFARGGSAESGTGVETAPDLTCTGAVSASKMSQICRATGLMNG